MYFAKLLQNMSFPLGFPYVFCPKYAKIRHFLWVFPMYFAEILQNMAFPLGFPYVFYPKNAKIRHFLWFSLCISPKKR